MTSPDADQIARIKTKLDTTESKVDQILSLAQNIDFPTANATSGSSGSTGGVSTASGAPAMPTGLTAKVLSDRRVVLDWDTAPNVTWDVMELRDSAGNPYMATVSTPTSIRGPLSARTYEYGIVAKNAFGESPMSQTLVITVYQGGGGSVTPGTAGGTGGTTATGGSTVADQTLAANRYGWGYPLTQSDEFAYAGVPDSVRWNLYDGPGNNGNGRRVPARATVINNILTLTGLANGDTAGLEHKYDQRYGRWEVRMRSSNTTATGVTYHPVLIIWPTSDLWPDDGEYDFSENDTPGDSSAQAYIHFPHPASVAVQQRGFTKTPWDASQWHNYAIEWTPNGITCYLDGEVWFNTSGGASTSPQRSNIQDMPSGHLTIQLDNFNGSSGNREALMEIEWVHVYTLIPQAAPAATVTTPGTPTGTGGTPTGGASTGTTTYTYPADVWKLGKAGGFNGNLGVGLPSGHVDIERPAADTYVKADYFFLNPTKTGAVCKSHMDGATTSSGTHYARVEWRQENKDGSHSAWSSSGTNFTVEYWVSVDHIQPNKPWATIGQIHDASSDALAIKIKGSNRASLDWVATFYDTDNATKLSTGYNATATSAAMVKIKVEVLNGTCNIYFNDVKKITSDALKGKTGLYWKSGVYPQAHSAYASSGYTKESASEYCQVTYYYYNHTQSPAI
jgi:hypothetical protein